MCHQCATRCATRKECVVRVKSKQEVLANLGAVPREELPADHSERDEILRRAMSHLSRHNVRYTPFDVEEDIELSYQRDDLEGFRETVRGWMRELRRAS